VRWANPKNEVPIVNAEANDPELAKATQEALSHLDKFVSSFQKNANGTKYAYFLKTDFVDNGSHEHMWISITKIENGRYYGVLDNDPVTVTNVKAGDAVNITKDQIEDWLIMNNKSGEMQGNYSQKVFEGRE
jgi:uncharacterized protein YegJ (DUF2314 family)